MEELSYSKVTFDVPTPLVAGFLSLFLNLVWESIMELLTTTNSFKWLVFWWEFKKNIITINHHFFG